jgi:preprotein translocase subunit SecF
MEASNQLLEERLSALESEIKKISERNRRVEANKAWETSISRFVLIVIVTYIVMCLIFLAIGGEKIFINAIVPTCGYALSTFSFPLLKRWWVDRWFKKNG